MKFVYAAWCAVALCGCSAECFRVLQNVGYLPQRGYWRIVGTWYFASLLACAVFSFLWHEFFPCEAILCGVYTLAALPQIFVKHKVPLKLTKRMIRIAALDLLLLLAICCFSLPVSILLLPAIVLVAWGICLPLDAAIAQHYIKKAKCKLLASSLKVIAITGSYGKTSTKDMLSVLLQNSIAPKGSCNTPLGIAKFINSTSFQGKKYLILEFGARKIGDIAYLCKQFPPCCGIVTGVCAQHLSTFDSLANVAKEKGKLVACLPQNSFCVLENEAIELYKDAGVCKKLCVDASEAVNVQVSLSGLRFDFCNGESTFDVSLPHVTMHSIITFCACAKLCCELGQSASQTVANAIFLRQCPHRMEIAHNGLFYVVDDAYNANEVGVQACCKFLASQTQKKIVVSQGIVECGRYAAKINCEVGKHLGDVCDVLIVLGKNAKSLASGAEKSRCGNVFRAKNLEQAVKIAKSFVELNCILLFQNDLPDVVGI